MRRIGIALLAATVILLPLSALAQDAGNAGQALLEKAAGLKEQIVTADQVVTDAEGALAEAPEEGKEDAQKALDSAKADVVRFENLLDSALGELKATDLDSASYAEYQKFLFARGKITANTTTGDAALQAATQWSKKAKDWVVEKGPGLAISALVFLIIILVFRTLGKVFGKITDKALSRSKLKVSTLLREFFTGIVRKAFFVLGLIIALQYVGINMGPVLAGIGVVGFVVGFALQDTLGNFASGIMILLYRPYDVGDVITTSAGTGKVSAMSLVSTTFHTPDNQKTIVPNSAIWGGTITNITAMPTRRVDMTIGVSYSDDLDKTAEVLKDAVPLLMSQGLDTLGKALRAQSSRRCESRLADLVL